MSVGLDLQFDFKTWICCSFCNISACACNFQTLTRVHVCCQWTLAMTSHV